MARHQAFHLAQHRLGSVARLFLVHAWPVIQHNIFFMWRWPTKAILTLEHNTCWRSDQPSCWICHRVAGLAALIALILGLSAIAFKFLRAFSTSPAWLDIANVALPGS